MATAHNVDHEKILNNIETMINLLEFDAMRSAGKMKLNSQHLHSLMWLQERYQEKVKKPTPKKKEG